jgi:hypothetical protein
MKKLNLTIAVMTLLLFCLSSQILSRRVIAQGEGQVIEGDALTCQSLSGCCGAAGCSEPGTPNGCAATCAGGGSITCAKVVNGICT